MSLSDPAVRAAPPRLGGRRPVWMMLALLALVLIAAAGWTVAWFYASSRAQHEIDTWIAREATQGRVWECGERTFSGFPFRFELICADPRVTFTGSAEWTWTAKRVHAVAQVWDPQHIIAEFQSPAELTETATGRKLDASWTLLQASGVGNGGRLERLSVSADHYALTDGTAALFAARHAEVHLRHHPGSENAVLDIAAGVHDATGAGELGAARVPVDGELQAMVTNAPDFHSMPLDRRLRLWQSGGGRAKLVLGKISAGNNAMVTTGDVGLDDKGRLDGEANVSVTGAKELFAALSASGLMPPAAATIAPTLMAAGLPAELDGRKAASFPFLFKGGRVSLGIIPLGRIGSFYEPPAPPQP